MKEVEETTFSEINGPAGCTVVYTGVLDGTGETMDVTFDDDYTYHGGNLLIGTCVTTAGDWKSASFYGIEATEAAYCHIDGWDDFEVDFLPKTTFTYQVPASCPKPTGLAVNSSGDLTAVATWQGDAETYNIDIDGTVTYGVTTPHEFDVELATTYTVKVQANCAGDETSDWTNPVSFTSDLCLAEDQCEITITLTDAYGDGGGKITVVDADTEVVLASYDGSGSSSTNTLNVCDGRQINFVYASTDSWSYENGWVITDVNGEVISEHVGCSSSDECDAPTDGVVATYTVNCAVSSCPKPTDLEADDITTDSATLSWDGTSDSYVLQYRPWYPAGDDIITTATMTTYTVDLSQYDGIGSVAIRHYDVSDMFQLIVDDIQVTNAALEVIYSQDFESCGGNMPSEFSNIDLDGDGYTWIISSSYNSNVNGTYGIVSESYNNNVGALTPDNWLIISGIEMGGQMTFQARGQDPNYAAENFAVYVSTESSVVEVPVAGTTYNATGLTPNTPYAWQVKGICGEEESKYASSFFTTKDDILVFATDGDWDDIDNWEDADGDPIPDLPNISNNVRIKADATIPADYVATANKVTIDGGSITITDGGQLKQNSATLMVTMEKEITGYGDGDDNWSFISSPFSGRTLYSPSGTWSRVDNLIDGDYDLFAFDPTSAGSEWINYKASPDHIYFQATNNTEGLLYGEGYLYANETDVTLSFVGTTGKSNNYSETKSHTYNANSTDPFNGWRLVGNFFSCNSYLSFVPEGGQTPTEVDFYVMNDNGDNFELSETTVALAPMQGAFFYADASGDIVYSTENPIADKSTSGMLNINLTENGRVSDMARIRFGKGMRLAHNSLHNNTSKVYIPQDDKDYAVVYGEPEGEMPLNFKAETTRSYTIGMKTENVNLGYLHLIDLITGADVDMLAKGEYSFIGSPRDSENRFVVRFSENANINTTDEVFVYQNGDNIMVGGEGELQVFDVTGRMVLNTVVNGLQSVAKPTSTGVYIFRLVGTDVKTQKIVVR